MNAIFCKGIYSLQLHIGPCRCSSLLWHPIHLCSFRYEFFHGLLLCCATLRLDTAPVTGRDTLAPGIHALIIVFIDHDFPEDFGPFSVLNNCRHQVSDNNYRPLPAVIHQCFVGTTMCVLRSQMAEHVALTLAVASDVDQKHIWRTNVLNFTDYTFHDIILIARITWPAVMALGKSLEHSNHAVLSCRLIRTCRL